MITTRTVKIYQDAKDKNVATNVLYSRSRTAGSGMDQYLYLDPECTEKASGSQVLDMFLKGLIVKTIESQFEGPDYVTYMVPLSASQAPEGGGVMLKMPNSGTLYYSTEVIIKPE